MPANPLTDQELKLVATHVRSLGRVKAEPVPGDAAKGKQLYGSKGGCPVCHAIQGKGGALGPDLTSLGERRNAAHIRESLVNPGSEVPLAYFEIRATVNNGRTITGVRVNEDTFSIQLRDGGGKVHSFWKSELKSLIKDVSKSPMPSYQSTFTPGEFLDLVAYLSSLQEPVQ